MVQCAGCGTQNNPDARFCRQCGRMLAVPSPDEAPVTIIPGHHDLPPSAKPRRLVFVVALSVAGLLASGALGYWMGSRPANPAGSALTQAPSPPPAALAGRPPKPAPESPDKPPPRHDEAVGTPEPGPNVQNGTDTPEQRLAKLRHDLSQCGRFNLYCQEKARWKYCPGWWNKVPECPQAQANAPLH